MFIMPTFCFHNWLRPQNLKDSWNCTSSQNVTLFKKKKGVIGCHVSFSITSDQIYLDYRYFCCQPCRLSKERQAWFLPTLCIITNNILQHNLTLNETYASPWFYRCHKLPNLALQWKLINWYISQKWACLTLINMVFFLIDRRKKRNLKQHLRQLGIKKLCSYCSCWWNYFYGLLCRREAIRRFVNLSSIFESLISF